MSTYPSTSHSEKAFTTLRRSARGKACITRRSYVIQRFAGYWLFQHLDQPKSIFGQLRTPPSVYCGLPRRLAFRIISTDAPLYFDYVERRVIETSRTVLLSAERLLVFERFAVQQWHRRTARVHWSKHRRDIEDLFLLYHCCWI